MTNYIYGAGFGTERNSRRISYKSISSLRRLTHGKAAANDVDDGGGHARAMEKYVIWVLNIFMCSQFGRIELNVRIIVARAYNKTVRCFIGKVMKT